MNFGFWMCYLMKVCFFRFFQVIEVFIWFDLFDDEEDGYDVFFLSCIYFIGVCVFLLFVNEVFGIIQEVWVGFGCFECFFFNDFGNFGVCEIQECFVEYVFGVKGQLYIWLLEVSYFFQDD